MFLYVLEVFVSSLVEEMAAERTVDHLTFVTVVDPSTPGDVDVLIIELNPDLAAALMIWGSGKHYICNNIIHSNLKFHPRLLKDSLKPNIPPETVKGQSQT